MIDRRAFLTTVGAGIASAPLVGEAQQAAKVWRLGALTTNPRPAPESRHPYNAFPNELRELGYREGQNLIIEWRYSEGNQERRREEAAAVMRWKPDVILAGTGADALILRDLSKTVPIVVATGGDLVMMGLAASLARPGGNVTGLQILQPELAGKKLELIRELVPRLERLAVLDSPPTRAGSTTFDRIFAELEAAGRALSIQVIRFTVATPDDIDRALSAMKSRGMQAIVVTSSAFLAANTERLAQLVSRHRLPDIHDVAAYVDAGCLASYGYPQAELYRRAARYVNRILNGASAGELPIEQPTTFELVINLKTAKTLGLTIPQSVLVRADRVIQ